MAFSLFPKDGKSGKDTGKDERRSEDALRAVQGPNTRSLRSEGATTRTLRDDGPGTRVQRKVGPTTQAFLESDAWVPQAAVIEVQEDAFICPSLENAALMFAHGNAAGATAALRHAIETPEGKQSLVWLCLFDLLARSGQRAAFDELALRYVVEFERSAPPWDEMAASSVVENAAAAVTKGRMLLRGEVTDSQAPVLVALKDHARKKPPELPQRIDLDVAELRSTTDICGTLIAGALAALRRKGVQIVFRGLNPTVNRLAAQIEEGKERVPRGLWYLTLELMHWADRQQAFEDLAVEFAVAFGLSPPSWEPMSTAQRAAVAASTDAPDEVAAELADDMIRWQGELRGAHDVCLKLIDPAKVSTNPALIEMSRVQRIDFVCAGAIANAIRKLMAQAIDVKLVNVSPILQALLQLTGTPAHLFTRINFKR